jgi:peptidoglycan/LPS O-acetylase OafA/YrhL
LYRRCGEAAGQEKLRVTALSRLVGERATRQFLPEVQALRAVAVMLVVLYHYWPGVVTGGYVGVDAFFVISGYLITSHLLREVDRTGTVRLLAFYARRCRRLLPAGVLVLLFVAVGTFVLLPTNLWSDTAHEAVASGFYVQNLWLATKAVTYSASNDLAGPALLVAVGRGTVLPDLAEPDHHGVPGCAQMAAA